MTSHANTYDDEQRARAYADLEYPGTSWLAFRDIPRLLREHVTGTRALDFGCGAGRSTRFLGELGFHATGIDISEPMLREATTRDPGGRYLLVRDGFEVLGDEQFDLICPLLRRDLGEGEPLSDDEQQELDRLMAETDGAAA